MSVVRTLLAVVAVLASGASAFAQSYPAKPIRILVGFPPGGSTDISARLIAKHLEKPLAQSVTVENRPGASGAIAAGAVSRAEPDGYTLFYGNVTLLAPSFVKNDPVVGGKDLSPVSRVSAAPFLLFARQDLPVKTYADLVAYSKANPGKLNAGTPATINALIADIFQRKSGINFTQAAYRGNGPLTTALLSGEVDISLDSIGGYLANLQAGKLKALFVAAPARSPLAPDVPTATEVGLSNLDISLPVTLWAPPNTPLAIREKLSSEIRNVLANPEVAEQFRKIGAEPQPTTPDELLRIANAELAFWTEAATASKFQPE